MPGNESSPNRDLSIVLLPKAKPETTGPGPAGKRSRKRGLSGGSSSICSRCVAISTDVMLDPDVHIPPHGIHVIALGKPRGRNFQEDCSICALLLSVATHYKRHYELELRLFNRIPKHNDVGSPHISNVQNRFLGVVRQNERLIYDARIAHEIGSNGLLVVIPEDEKSTCCVQAVNPDTIRYDLIRGWLDDCARDHGVTCDPVDDSISDLQLHVIDCWDDTIKRLPRLKEYVALSYVWGQTSNSTRFNLSNITDNVGLSVTGQEIPLTIRDAMRIVKNLGRQYLWVDRYCIPHTDASKRLEAILNMHQIYSRATLTIVALYGESAEAGLPGVSTTHRQGSQKASILNGDLLSSFPPLTSVIKKSTWSTRGWTFQEARLSRRCLFLSQHQAYYSCQTGTVSEAVPDFASTFPLAEHLNPGGLNPSMFAPDSNQMFSGIFLDRLSFSQRTLTYQKDALDAFRGVLRIHPFVTFWGVPICHRQWSLSPQTCFAMGLLWARRSLATFEAHMPNTFMGSYERRPGFPTWSWASVVGEVFQFGTREICTYRQFFLNEVKDDPEQLVPAFEVRMKDPPMDFGEAVRVASSNILPELSPSILIEGDLIRVKRERSPSIKPGKLGHIRYRFCGEDENIASDIYVLPRIDLDENDIDTPDSQDALILINWRDCGRKNQRRFILMLLKWVEEGVAERVGLLGRYYEKFNLTFLDTLWKRRRSFELR